MKLKPLSNWTLIRPSAAIERTAAGIYIPEVAKERPVEGEVLAIGEGRWEEEKDAKGKVKEKKFVKTSVAPGARVMYEKYAASKVEIDGEELVLVREENILGQYE